MTNAGFFAQLYYFFYLKKGWGFIFLAVLAAIFKSLDYCFTNQSRKEVLIELMSREIYHTFSDKGAKVRCTLFVPSCCLISACRIFYFCIIKCFIKHYQKGLLGHYFKECLAICFFTHQKVLFVYARYGNPHKNGSSAHFRVPREENEINGFCPEVWYKNTMIVKKLPSIQKHFEEIRGAKQLEELGNKKNDVKKYMERGNIKSFNKLREFHRLSNHFWGTPLYIDSEDTPAAILVFDFEEKEKHAILTSEATDKEKAQKPLDPLNSQLVHFSNQINTVLKAKVWG